MCSPRSRCSRRISRRATRGNCARAERGPGGGGGRLAAERGAAREAPPVPLPHPLSQREALRRRLDALEREHLLALLVPGDEDIAKRALADLLQHVVRREVLAPGAGLPRTAVRGSRRGRCARRGRGRRRGGIRWRVLCRLITASRSRSHRSGTRPRARGNATRRTPDLGCVMPQGTRARNDRGVWLGGKGSSRLRVSPRSPPRGARTARATPCARPGVRTFSVLPGTRPRLVRRAPAGPRFEVLGGVRRR